jgi:hypothetical protein
MEDAKLEEKIQELLNEAYKSMQSDNPDALTIDRLDGELTAVNASVGQRYREYEFQSNKWHQYNKDIQEVVRSLRRVHETLNTERRMN